MQRLTLEEITSIGGTVWVSQNNALTDWRFPRLISIGANSAKAKSISEQFLVHDNQSLRSVDLPELRSIEGNWKTYNNDSLTLLNLPKLVVFDVNKDTVFEFPKGCVVKLPEESLQLLTAET